jgi:hypothetical protein
VNLQSHELIDNICVDVVSELSENKLYIAFNINGKLDAYIFPQKSKLKRVDELWKETCFELFLANSKTEEYYELNFSSSLSWNFYHLSGYRNHVSEVKGLAEPKIEIFKKIDEFKITFELELKNFSFEKFDSYNLATILLTKESNRTFWAIKHLKTQPDFHDKKSFLKRDF